MKTKFKIDQLKEIFDIFGVVIEEPVDRKTSYINPVEALVKLCSCSKYFLIQINTQVLTYNKLSKQLRE